MGHPMRLELTYVGLLVKFANRYTTKGARSGMYRPRRVIGTIRLTRICIIGPKYTYLEAEELIVLQLKEDRFKIMLVVVSDLEG